MEDDIKKTLTEIKNKVTVLDEIREEIHRFRIAKEEEHKLVPRFLENSPNVRSYSKMIENAISPPPGDRFEGDIIYIMGYLDQQLLDKLVPLASKVMIISPSGTLKTEKNKDALTRMSEAGAKIRTHPMLHARIFCIPKLNNFLIIGSGDLQTNCFGGSRFDAGTYSNYPEMTKAAVDFFNRVWRESDLLPEK